MLGRAQRWMRRLSHQHAAFGGGRRFLIQYATDGLKRLGSVVLMMWRALSVFALAARAANTVVDAPDYGPLQFGSQGRGWLDPDPERSGAISGPQVKRGKYFGWGRQPGPAVCARISAWRSVNTGCVYGHGSNLRFCSAGLCPLVPQQPSAPPQANLPSGGYSGVTLAPDGRRRAY